MDMTPIVALVWSLIVDNGPSDSKPIKQVLTAQAADVAGTGGACKVTGELPSGERQVGCVIGPFVVGTTLNCKAGESKSATFLMVSPDGPFRIVLSCGAKEVMH